MSLHLFSLTTPRRVANICDSVEKIESNVTLTTRETTTVTMKVFTRNTEGNHFVCCSVDWKCSSFQWKCANGKCINQNYVCNGAYDCGDGSDERNCRKLVFITVVMVVVVTVAA